MCHCNVAYFSKKRLIGEARCTSQTHLQICGLANDIHTEHTCLVKLAGSQNIKRKMMISWLEPQINVDAIHQKLNAQGYYCERIRVAQRHTLPIHPYEEGTLLHYGLKHLTLDRAHHALRTMQ